MTIHCQSIEFQENLPHNLLTMNVVPENTGQKRTCRQSSQSDADETILECKNEGKRPKFESVHHLTLSNQMTSTPLDILSPIAVNYPSENNQASNNPVSSDINFIDCDELASLLTSNYSCKQCLPLILDIRSLASQANLRIQTAIGIPCESRVKLRRALPVLNNYLRAREQCFNAHHLKGYQPNYRLIIIYTDSDIDEFPMLKDLLHCLVKHLIDVHHLDARVLKGGIQEFCNSYHHLCEQPLTKSQPISDESKTSPTENISHNESRNIKDKLAHSLNISLTKTRCRKLKFTCSPILLPGLGLSAGSTEHKPIRLHNSVKQSSHLASAIINRYSSTANFVEKQWNLAEFCVTDNDPGDPKDIFRAEISRIFPFLYLGNEYDGQNEKILNKYSIDSILNVTIKTPFLDESRFNCCRLPANDSHSQDLRSHFTTAFQFIEEVRCSGKTVLVHCQAGVSRSPALIIAYLMNYSSLSLLDAYQYVKSRRSVIAPNFAFMGQLYELESDLTSGRLSRQSNILDPLLKTNESL
ncbi:putative dual specificity protein phosphatase [Schistosoma mansoni]|uniref:protein-tyrosine-phosphatase n=1 Tax=Schistosoma mansoni TaxID=6183 RepID=G4V927_SCHMA|nr:putative dual specificity protein phosphatase [Schistosoma mansoni]|eukprot:XP_018648080.1 putative dual specificity protein phosphatase [Schistosoma mansoni]